MRKIKHFQFLIYRILIGKKNNNNIVSIKKKRKDTELKVEKHLTLNFII